MAGHAPRQDFNASAAFAHPCMGLFVKNVLLLSSWLSNPSSFLVQFLCSTAGPFLRPDHAQRQ
jgi:hypothetical protein